MLAHIKCMNIQLLQDITLHFCVSIAESETVFRTAGSQEENRHTPSRYRQNRSRGNAIRSSFSQFGGIQLVHRYSVRRNSSSSLFGTSGRSPSYAHSAFVVLRWSIFWFRSFEVLQYVGSSIFLLLHPVFVDSSVFLLRWFGVLHCTSVRRTWSTWLEHDMARRTYKATWRSLGVVRMCWWPPPR